MPKSIFLPSISAFPCSIHKRPHSEGFHGQKDPFSLCYCFQYFKGAFREANHPNRPLSEGFLKGKTCFQSFSAFPSQIRTQKLSNSQSSLGSDSIRITADLFSKAFSFISTYSKDKIVQFSVQFGLKNGALRAPNPSERPFGLFYSPNLFLRAIFDLFHSPNLFQKIILTFKNPEFSFFCYNLAFKILHFLRLFSLNFATTEQFTSNSKHFATNLSPFWLQKIVPSKLFQSLSVEGLTDTQNTSKTGLIQVEIQSHICT
jgi:hypothetical protein